MARWEPRSASVTRSKRPFSRTWNFARHSSSTSGEKTSICAFIFPYLLRFRRKNGQAFENVDLHPVTRELVVQDWKDNPALRRPLVRRTLRPGLQMLAQSAAARRASLRTGCDQLVVLDLDTGEDRARCDVPSPSQGFLFPAPGFGRDVYYQSLTTIARVSVV